MDVEYAAAVNNKPDFVLVVPMFTIELGQHRIQSRSLWIDVDYIRCYIAARLFETVDLRLVCFENLLTGRVVSSGMSRSPDLVINADGLQIFRYFSFTAN